jgi:hypothetical protein
VASEADGRIVMDERVTAVARGLDAALARALLGAAE